jgi:hypothetical protein
MCRGDVNASKADMHAQTSRESRSEPETDPRDGVRQADRSSDGQGIESERPAAVRLHQLQCTQARSAAKRTRLHQTSEKVSCLRSVPRCFVSGDLSIESLSTQRRYYVETLRTCNERNQCPEGSTSDDHMQKGSRILRISHVERLERRMYIPGTCFLGNL